MGKLKIQEEYLDFKSRMANTEEIFLFETEKREEILFYVHKFQRHYKWSAEQLDDFLLDFIEQENFYLGQIIFKKINNKLIIIDGQQRLTTISILVKSLIIFLTDSTLDFNKILKENVILELNKWIFKINEDEEKKTILINDLYGKEDYESVMSIQTYSPSLDLIKVKKTVSFKKNFKILWIFCKKNIKTDNDLEKILLRLKNIKFTVTIVSDDSEETSIFDSLNSKGLSLTVDELSKNYLFSKINTIKNEGDRQTLSIELNEAFDEILILNKDFQDIFKKNTRFFQGYINYYHAFFQMKNNDKKLFSTIPESNQRKLYREYKKITERGFSNKLAPTSAEILTEIAKLKYYKKHWIMLKESIEKTFGSTEINIKLNSMIDNIYLYPLIFFLSQELNKIDGSSIEFQNDFKKCISEVYKYWIINTIKNESIKNTFNIIYILKQKKINATLAESCIDFFRNDIHKNNEHFFDSFEVGVNFPTNKTSLSLEDLNMTNFNFYEFSESKKISKGLLLLINNNLSTSDNLFNMNEVVLDHIIPKKWCENKEPEIIEGDLNNSLLSQIYIHSLHNLMILHTDDLGQTLYTSDSGNKKYKKYSEENNISKAFISLKGINNFNEVTNINNWGKFLFHQINKVI